MFLKKILVLGAFIGVFITIPVASAVITPGNQGGTGLSTSTSGNDGKCLIQASSTPFLTWTEGTCGSGGGGTPTTTVNGVIGPLFTFSVVATTSVSTFTTSTQNLFLNLLKYTSGTNINVAANGVINFVNPGFILSAPATSTLIAGGTATGPAITIATSTSLNVFTVICGSATCTFTIPAAGSSLYAPSTTIPATFIYPILGAATGSVSFAQQIATTTCTSCNLTINANGLVTSAASGTSGGGTPAGNNGDIQLNNQGSFGVDSGGFFNYSTTTHRLSLSQQTSSIFIGNNADFATSTVPGGQQTVVFKYTGATSSFQVPNGVTSLILSAIGGNGGTGNGGGTAGLGGSVTGTLAVTPGTLYYFCVASNGNSTTGARGFCGGGLGGSAGGNVGGGGGGATWFALSGSGDSNGGFASSTASTTIVLVAGGGAGAGQSNGGNAGDTTGNSGGTTGVCSGAAGPGTPSNGGIGATATGGSNGTDGTAAKGGDGSQNGADTFGAGGGAGWFGGGGGSAKGAACWSGGGGGSSFTTSTMTSVSNTAGISNTTTSLSISYALATTTTFFSTSSAVLYVGGHIFTGNQNLATSSVSGCGTNSQINGNDTAGTVFVGTGIITSCKINFGQQFSNAPACTLSTYSSAISAGIVAESTSSLTVGFSANLGSGQFNYLCFDY